jgi:hypothetical protein
MTIIYILFQFLIVDGISCFLCLRIGRSISSRVFHDRVCLSGTDRPVHVQKKDLITDFLLFKQVYSKSIDLSQTIEEVCKNT